MRKTRVPIRYIPKSLSKKDQEKQKSNLLNSRKMYKSKIYISRPKLKSFKSRKSSHITKALKKYKLTTLKIDNNLSRKTGCSLKSLKEIFKKGEGAYYSSGSRPNQTSQSWAYARLASSLTGGKASAVDIKILKSGCKKNSYPLKSAIRNQKKYKYGRRKSRSVKI